MGWTAGDDTLDQVELSFPTAEAAVAYARRRGLPYSITGWTPPRPDLSIVSATQDDDTRANPVRRKRLEWIERTLVADSVYRDAKPDVQPAFCKPRDVVDAPQLSFNDKRDALYRLAHESYLLERGRPVGDVASVSQLNDVIDALLDLEEAHQKGHCVASSHARKAA